MTALRTVVITGASRGLGLASAVHLYKLGWRVVAAMRSVDAGLERLRAETGAAPNDPRLLGVRLDLDDSTSIAAAATAIDNAVGVPDVLVHNAGIAAAGSFEDMPSSAWHQIFATNLFGPIELTRALLPGMRAAGRGRIVVVSSQGAVRGMPAISAYSASKGALERWGESLAGEIAPFGLGVTVIVSGTFKTDILVQTSDYRNYTGPYASHYVGIDKTGEIVVRAANPPHRFARVLAKAVCATAPYARYTAGIDATMLVFMNRILPGWLLHHVIRFAMRLPRAGALRTLPPTTAHVFGSDEHERSDAIATDRGDGEEARG
jgi:NAD(P)-dependent dehydrogenase (short-subunit alcohol dehydrogenase family)